MQKTMRISILIAVFAMIALAGTTTHAGRKTASERAENARKTFLEAKQRQLEKAYEDYDTYEFSVFTIRPDVSRSFTQTAGRYTPRGYCSVTVRHSVEETKTKVKGHADAAEFFWQAKIDGMCYRYRVMKESPEDAQTP